MNTLTKVLLTFAIGLSLTALYFASNKSSVFLGSATAGLPATIATTTQFAVTTSQQLAIATSSCTSRVVSTRTAAVMLTFSDITGFVPTAILGHLQVGSTTVVYDSGVYGCGAVRVISATGAGDTITISDVR